MNNNLFQNDNITGNSKLGFEICGVFKDEEDVLLEKIRNILNREISFSNIDYKLLEPNDMNAIVIKDGNTHIIKTPMYSYFEAVYLMPKILEYLGTLKDYNKSYFYVKIGFNDDFVNICDLNILKFILSYNENFILSKLNDISKNGDIEKLTDIKPKNIESCSELVQKQIDSLKFLESDDDTYGINFSQLNLGYITFKYAKNINYRNKWEELLKSINHTIITLYNASKYNQFDEEETKQVDKLNKDFGDFSTSFGCYEIFHNKYKSIKLLVDLSNDKSIIDMIYPSIKERLFNIVICNDIKDATINYDTDISKIQLKDVELNKCYHLNNVDIIDGEITNCCIKECDLYDTKIKNSNIIKCNMFGYSNCSESKFKDCFISRNIKLTKCDVYGKLGKMGGIMKGGSLKNTTVLIDMADIDENVEKDNVNEIK